jgi:hypothetical protein
LGGPAAIRSQNHERTSGFPGHVISLSTGELPSASNVTRVACSCFHRNVAGSHHGSAYGYPDSKANHNSNAYEDYGTTDRHA